MTQSRLHGTCVMLAFPAGQAGVIFTGPPGSGKSDLALRLIDSGARLVADDQIVIEARGGRLFAQAPEAIRGRIEVRGVGVVAVPFAAEVEVRLQIALGREGARLPEPAFAALAGVRVPQLLLNAFEASAAAKVRLALLALMVPPSPGVTFPFAPE